MTAKHPEEGAKATKEGTFSAVETFSGLEERPWGPPELQHLSEETLTADLAKAGLKRVERHDFISEQFFVVYNAE